MWHPLRFLARRRRPEADFSEEIAAHLAIEADRLIAEGFAPGAAALEARRRFGNVGRAQESYHQRRAIPLFESLVVHTRRAARRLLRAPVFSATVVLTLMLGIGATTAVFSLVNGVLLRPLPYPAPGQLVDLTHTVVLQGASRVDQSDATYLHYRNANHVFSGVGAWRPAAVNLSDGRDAGPAGAQRAAAARVSASLFEVLGVAPLRGRVFADGEDRPGSATVAIISESLWRRQYAGDPGIIGRVIQVDGVAHQVVGIMPERFQFPDERTDLWLPVNIDAARTASATFDVQALARLRPGVTLEAAAADLQALLPHVPESFPGRLTAAAIDAIKMQAVVRPLRELLVGEIGRTLWVVLAAAAFLLLIACANVANLFLVRAEARQLELAVRRALGAGRGAIVAEFLAEGLILAALGGALGLVLAESGVRVLRSLETGVNIPRLGGVELDGTVLAVAMGVTLLAALLMSLLPALHFSRAGASLVVRSGRAATAPSGRHRARRALVVVQMALGLVLVAGAGLMARSFQSLRSVTPGFVAERSWVFRIALPAGGYPATGDAAGLVTRALDAIAALPGVQAVGAVSKLPLEDEGRRDTALFVDDRPLGMGVMPNIHQVAYATPGTFAALGTPLVQGHGFDRPDPLVAPLEVVVTQALARRYWGDSLAVGRRLRLAPQGPTFTVVGVTGDLRGTRLEQPPDETVFLPLVTAPGPAAKGGGAGPARWLPRELALVVRAAGNTGGLAALVERTLRALAPGVPVYGARPMTAVLARATARTTFTLQLLGMASAAALVIGAVGLYGVVSYMVSLRSREMAVRIALGAQPGALRRLVLVQAVAVASVGIVLGVGAAILLMRLLASLLFEVAPADPASLAGAAVLMSAVALTASWLPARRAAAMDPARALRADD